MLLSAREKLVEQLEEHINGLSLLQQHTSGDDAAKIGRAPANAAVLDAISEQRNRFGKRTQELEQEVADLEAQLNLAKRQAMQAEAEKQEAVVRLRYVENFKDTAANATAANRGGTNNHSLDCGAGEEVIDPFARFTEAQAVAAVSRLSTVDRHILDFMKGFNSENGRRCVLIYAIILHGIVYASLVSRLVQRQS